MFLVKGVLKIRSNFIEITLRHECSPVILLYIFRTPFSKKTSGWVILNQVTCLANVRSKTDFVEDFRNCTVLSLYSKNRLIQTKRKPCFILKNRSIETSLLLVQTTCFLIGTFQTLNLFKTKSFNKKKCSAPQQETYRLTLKVGLLTFLKKNMYSFLFFKSWDG